MFHTSTLAAEAAADISRHAEWWASFRWIEIYCTHEIFTWCSGTTWSLHGIGQATGRTHGCTSLAIQALWVLLSVLVWKHLDAVKSLPINTTAAGGSLHSRLSLRTLESPATGHWGTCPLDFQLFNFFWRGVGGHIRAIQTLTFDSWLPIQ